MFEIFSLEGKKAFVSGASRGLGHEIALTLAGAGADVALAARTVAALEETADTIRKMGREALVCPMDISNIDDIEKAVEGAAKNFGRIDILINNAGIAGEKPVIEMTAETWDRVMDVNLRGHGRREVYDRESLWQGYQYLFRFGAHRRGLQQPLRCQ